MPLEPHSLKAGNGPMDESKLNSWPSLSESVLYTFSASVKACLAQRSLKKI